MGRAVIRAAGAPLAGRIRLPGDKSISHRRALLSLYVDGRVTLQGYAAGEDARASQQALARLGKTVGRCVDEVTIEGPAGCQSAELDCRNSGTTARLLMGILAGQPGEWTLTGDESLARRPMERVAAPLRQMGARIALTDGHLPARIEGAELKAIAYDSPLSSAQLKSAVLLAGLKAEGVTRYREPVPTRDHTERLLSVATDADGWLALDPRRVELSAEWLSARIPADPSTAIFWIAAALMIPGSQLELPGVLANPLRISYVELLRRAGAAITLNGDAESKEEATATVTVLNTGALSPFVVDGPAAVQLIDEIPALAVLAATIRGRSEFRNVGELRVKESNRLRLVIDNLRRMGARVDEGADGFAVEGGAPLTGAEIQTDGDHRMVMAFGIAGLVASGEMQIRHAAASGISYPAFWGDLARLSSVSVAFEPMS